MRLRTLIVARDAGAASALVPVVRSGPADLIGLEHARPVFRREQLDFDQIPNAKTALTRYRPAVMLTGTGLQARKDADWWRTARALGIRSVSLVEHWSYPLKRFTAVEPFDSVPDLIAVIDEALRRELVELGCPAAIEVTGNPRFDALLSSAPSGREDARTRWHADAAARVLLFASEPIRSDLGPASPIDELTALRLALDALDGWRLVIRPHPREDPRRLHDLAGTRAVLDPTPAPHDAIAGADAVIGISSMFLVEAALAGKPVISLDPDPAGLGRRFPGLIATARDAADLRAWLRREGARVITEAERSERNARTGFAPGATARVWDLLRTLA